MLHNLKHKNSKTMGREAVRWQILTIAFLSLLIGVFCFAGNAAATHYNISINDISVNENVGTADFTVTLSNAIAGGDMVTVDFTTTGATATKGSDFDDPGALSILINTPGSTTGTIAVPITNDTLYEDLETFNVNLTSCGIVTTVGSTVGFTDDQGVGTITDNSDTYNVSLEASKSVSEGDGTVTFTVTLDQLVPGGTSVAFSLGGGSATSGLDYSQSTPSPLTFLATETSKDITINILDDDVYEFNETFNVSLTAGANQTVSGSPSTCTITDNSDTYNVSLEASKSVSEGDGTVTFTVSLDQLVPGGTSVAFSLVDGDATLGPDYSVNTVSPLTFTDADLTQNIIINISDDLIYELDEDFNITLTAGANQTVSGTPSTCTINDNDTYDVSLEASKSVSESAGTVTFTVTLDQLVPGGTSVAFSLGGGSATSGLDYSQSTPSPLTFLATETSKDITINILDDDVYEFNETFNVSLTAGANQTVSGSPSTCTITDNSDTYNVSLEASKSVSESAGTVTFTVTLDQLVPGGTSVAFSLVDGDATGLDYSQNTPSPLTFTDADLTQNIIINISDDLIYELDENFNITLTAGANQTVSGTPSTCTINDNDTYDVSLEASKSVSESAGTVTFTVTLDQLVPGGTSVAFSLVDGDATGLDYSQNTPSPLTFTDADLTQNIIINISDDLIYELDENFNITLTAGANQTVSGTPSTCTINDNDTYDVSLEASKSVSEGAGTVTFTVTLDQPVPGGASVAFSLVDGSATSGLDYSQNTPSPLTFLATETTQDITINILNDGLYEFDETFNITLTAGANQTVSGSPATCTITNDGDIYTISINNIVVDEAVVTATFTVLLSQAVLSGDSVSVDYATADGTATTADNDYDFTSGTLTISATQNSGTIDVTINNNTDIEGNENFFLNLGPGTSGNASIGDNQGECVITDNDHTITSTISPFLDEESGTITPLGSIIVEHGSSPTFTITPDGGSCIQNVNVDGASQGIPTTYTFTNVTSDHTINVAFSSTYRITGKIMPAKARTLEGGNGAWKISAPFDSGWLDHLQNATLPNCNITQITVEFRDQAPDWETPPPQTLILYDEAFPGTALVTITGNYRPTLNVVSSNGTVTSNPIGINCPGDCTEIYDAGEIIELTAVANAGYVFSRFEGDVTIASSPTRVIMDDVKTITAVFVVATAGNIDADGDGWSIDAGDCNDSDAQINPGAPEQCDSTDWDCDGLTNDTTPMDADCMALSLSDVPLESQYQAAPASIVFVLDNSGSMDWTVMTNEDDGLFQSQYYIFDNPGDNQYGNSHRLTTTQRRMYRSQWNGYNKMYYNPDVEYITWPNGDGTRHPDADLDNPRSNPESGLGVNTFDMSAFFVTMADTVDIINAHYFTWNDTNSDEIVDNGEIYLIELDGAITYYQFVDSDGDDTVDVDGELIVTASPPSGIVPKNDDGFDLTYTEERQNFANWYSFYRRRESTAKAAVAEVIDSLKGVQVGLYSINAYNIGIRMPVLKVRVTEDDGSGNLIYTDETVTLLDALYNMDSQGGTPLRNSLMDVGRYFDADDGDNGGLGVEDPWYDDPSGECQQAFAVVMTDGYYNGGNPGVSNDEGDGTEAGTTDPEGDELYYDAYRDTLADIAMMYYKNDLADNIDNHVPTNFADDADWQHMVTYGVSFGVTGNYNPDDYNLDTDQDNNDRDYPVWLDPLDSHASWAEKNLRRIDDLWHATVNGRGIFLSAGNPEELVNSLKAIMLNLTARIGSGASLSINGEELYAGTVMFQGKYTTDGWTGDVLAYTVDTATGEVIKDEPIWRASEELGEGSDWDIVSWDTGREIATFNADPLVEAGIKFRWANLTPDLKAFLSDDPETGHIVENDPVKGEARFEYLRGNNAEEEKNDGDFRDRFSKIGDIVHSSPLYVDGMIYTGANDGMLHAFDAATGVEKFAYIPNLVFEKLNGLTLPDPNFRHRYFIDATPFVRDTGTKASGNYGKLLVGGLGKGGKGYYCLDVTDASTISETDTSWVKWEYPKQDSSAVEKDNMGYSFSRAYIVRSYAENHSWVVIFGNGYESTSKTSALYILDADTGELIRMIDTGASGGGLSSPVPVDVNGDYRADYVYAGDLQGNMWKFDIRDSDPANWGSAYGDNDTDLDNVINPDVAGEIPKPLFRAMGREKSDVNSHTYDGAGTTWSQAITTQPIITRHCDHTKSGALVLFGTGKYLGEDDLDTTEYQTIYGIWDFGNELTNPSSAEDYLGDFVRGAGPSGEDEFSNPLLQSATLLQQWVIYWGPNPYNANETLRVLTDNEPDWETYPTTDRPKVHAGWYFDLPLSKERVMRDPVYRDGRLIIISSIPESNPCSAGGVSIIHELNSCTGGRLESAVFDINNDGIIDENDYISIPNPLWGEPGEDEFIVVPPTGILVGAMVFPPAILMPAEDSPDEEERKYFVTSGGGIIIIEEPADRRGMFYWRRIERQ